MLTDHKRKMNKPNKLSPVSLNPVTKIIKNSAKKNSIVKTQTVKGNEMAKAAGTTESTEGRAQYKILS